MASWYVAVYAEKNGNTRGADRGGGGLSLACLSLVGGMLFVVSGLLLLLLLTFNTVDGATMMLCRWAAWATRTLLMRHETGNT